MHQTQEWPKPIRVTVEHHRLIARHAYSRRLITFYLLIKHRLRPALQDWSSTMVPVRLLGATAGGEIQLEAGAHSYALLERMTQTTPQLLHQI